MEVSQRLSVDFLLILLKNLNFEKTKNVKFFVFDSDELKCKEFEGIVIWHRERLEKMANNTRRNSFYFSRIFLKEYF
jgi:hypothetical protein